jgi:hypothetical protein
MTGSCLAHGLRAVGLLVGGVLTCLAISGCGRSQGTVTGSVKYKDKTVKMGNVAFFPKQGPPIYANIKNDGTYEAVGVPAGEATVTVNSADPRGELGDTPRGGPGAGRGGGDVGEGPGMPLPRRGLPATPLDPKLVKDWVAIPTTYTDILTTPLAFTVKSGKNEFPIEIK